MVADPHKPLRDDVRLLGDLLGDALRAHEGPALFALVEEVRALAKRGRAGSDQDFQRLAALLAGMPIADALPVARAFAHFLTLANIAEQHHRTRRRRAYQRAPDAAPQRGSCRDSFTTLVASGVEPTRLFDAVCGLRIELVLTAHPTEVVRRTLLQKHNRIAHLLARLDRPDLTNVERDEARTSLGRVVTAAWATDEVRHENPTPLDEVRGGLVVFEQTLWEVVPRFLRTVDATLKQVTGRRLPLDAAPVRFGTWMGGDRDGNPFVTPEVTRQACLLARWMAADLYLRDVDQLRSELSLTVAAPELEQAAEGALEPYRAVLRRLRDRLQATRDAAAAAVDRPDVVWPLTSADADVPLIEAPEDLAAPLLMCHRSLVATGYGLLAEGLLSDVLRRLTVFGVVLARLDIRQDADRHTAALDAITSALGLGSYAAWPEAQRQDFLLRELDNPRPLMPRGLAPSDDVRDVLDTFALIARLPPDALGGYVISRATRPSDVLAVALLQKDAGVAVPRRIVPLFETAEALEQAGALLKTLFAIPSYRTRLAGHQEVMIGYSDSARELGRLSAAWALYRAQQDIVAAAREHGVEVSLFHGRGGSVGRGGGPTWLAIQSQPAGSVNGRLRVTEQGEMIQAKFGLADIALRTLELYTTATLGKSLADVERPRPEWHDAMNRLAREASDAYRAVVYGDPRFPAYFRAATPEPELAALNIGSRPARRSKGGGVTTLRAIPWQFAWTQTRLLLASWLGVERALAVALGGADANTVRVMYREWPFFRSTIDLIEMVLAKADARIAGEYDRQLVPAECADPGDDLRRRLAMAVESVLAVTGHRVLVEENPVLRRSIDVRNPCVDPINLVQVELLRRTRAGADDAPTRDALMATINGVAAGLRNTG